MNRVTRVVKFNALNKVTNTMHYDILNPDNWSFSFLNQDIFQWLQFTGLKDKNGKEIYEGDILEYEGWHGGIEFAMMESELKKEGKPMLNYMKRVAVLGHPDGHYIMRDLDDLEDMTYVGNILFSRTSCEKEVEVIGNIYSNTELLKPST